MFKSTFEAKEESKRKNKKIMGEIISQRPEEINKSEF
jgi:hypothetical protein